jgi:hypothetical protein
MGIIMSIKSKNMGNRMPINFVPSTFTPETTTVFDEPKDIQKF